MWYNAPNSAYKGQRLWHWLEPENGWQQSACGRLAASQCPFMLSNNNHAKHTNKCEFCLNVHIGLYPELHDPEVVKRWEEQVKRDYPLLENAVEKTRARMRVKYGKALDTPTR